MEDIEQLKSPAATLDKTAKQPNPFVLALLLTSILYLGVKHPSDNKEVVANNSSYGSTSLSSSVKKAVVLDLAQREGLPTTALKIVDAKKLTWVDGCLGMTEEKMSCNEALVPGWQITVVSGQKRWIYRTDASGSKVLLDRTTPFSPQKSKGIAIA